MAVATWKYATVYVAKPLPVALAIIYLCLRFEAAFNENPQNEGS